ncbi:MAG: hypothetical protein V1861_00255 [Candidatus Micrarchaeota archaeon]
MAKKTRKAASAKGAAKAPETAKAQTETEIRKPAKEQKIAQETKATGMGSESPLLEQPPMTSAKADSPSQKPKVQEVGRRERGGLIKGIMVFGLLAAVLFLAYYFITLSENSFVPGTEVDAETFKGIFTHSENVYIVMDVRGAPDNVVANNVLQCGVDFAASSGMGGKIVTPISFGNDGCVTPDGFHKPKECFAMLSNGVTIYVKEGPGGAKYYSNGMVVLVGNQYSLGTCGIKVT